MEFPYFTRRQFLSGLAAAYGAAICGQIGCSIRPKTKVQLPSDLSELDLLGASRAVHERELSPVDLVKDCIRRIEVIDPRLNAFITVTAESALAQALKAETEIMNGNWRGPMHGIPIALKDNIDTAGVLTTAGSAVFANRVPTVDAEVVHRLRAAGAVFVGKLNMHEFALGTTSAISHYGPVRNPWDLDRIAGGSSGGSGAAVAASLCFGAVGTDTGGSIRIPAAACGIVGLKPTYGIVSSKGIIPVSQTFDHVGPMCRTVTDTAIMLGAMTENEIARDCDPASLPSIKELRVGILKTGKQICDSPVQPEIQAAFNAAVDVIRPMVSEVREAELLAPDLGPIIDVESYAYHKELIAATPELYDDRTRNVILSGKDILQTDLARLRRELEIHRNTIDRSFADLDLVVVPTLPGLPIEIADAKGPFDLDACTFAFSIGGLPAISIPCGFSTSGLPIGLLIGGPRFSEARILALALAYERTAEWYKRRPTVH